VYVQYIHQKKCFEVESTFFVSFVDTLCLLVADLPLVLELVLISSAVIIMGIVSELLFVAILFNKFGDDVLLFLVGSSRWWAWKETCL